MTFAVSIVVPIHDMHRKLHNLNSSISEMPLVGVEIILVDDFTSSEASLEIETVIAEFTAKQIKLVKGNFGSPGAARNAGLSIATGDWIVFADSDDRLYARELLDYLLPLPADQIQVFQFCKKDFSSGEILEPLSHTYSILDLVVNLGLWRMAFPVKYLNKVSFHNLRMGEDILFFLDVFHDYPNAKFVSIHTYDYLMGSGNQLTSSVDAIEDLFNLLGELEQRVNLYDNISGLVKSVYFKNTLSAIKHLGFVRSVKFVMRNVDWFIRSNFHEKRKYFVIFWKILRP
jgi:glycosyltransferase involved in cell wall biosynthesis